MPMLDDCLAYASVLKLTRMDVKALSIRNAYGIHKAVYGLFEDRRSTSEKAGSTSSGILYAEQGGDRMTRNILMLSDRKPHQTPQFGTVQTITISTDFLSQDHYAFSVNINPTKRGKHTGKVVPIKGRQEIMDWFTSHSQAAWGFMVNPEHLQIEQTGVQTFQKQENGPWITHGYAKLRGSLMVTDKSLFTQSFTRGIGRGRAFGFGLLKIVPLV